MTAPIDDGNCIGCGERSEIGLHMHFSLVEDGAVESRLIVPARFQGWQNVVHGGVVALLLDEAMAYAAAAAGHVVMTADLKLRFRKSVPVGEDLVVRARVLRRRLGVFGVEAGIRDAAGTLLASGEGSFVSRGTIDPDSRFGALRAR
jgi:uncharacterized protein (TIGR00369 family)